VNWLLKKFSRYLGDKGELILEEESGNEYYWKMGFLHEGE
jgi:predicted NAD-dependent protein-ADP-ribosyltransferase YbiA (DUF1768 family)